MIIRRRAVLKPAVAAGPSTIGLWHFDDNLLAAEGNDWTGSPSSYDTGVSGNGAELVSLTPAYMDFDAALDPDTQDLTVEGWAVIHDGEATSRNVLRGYSSTGGSGSLSFQVIVYATVVGSYDVRATVWNSSGSFTVGISDVLTAPVATPTGTHFALVYDSTANSTGIYINGKLEGTRSGAGRIIGSLIGFTAAPSTEPALLDELRITNAKLYSGSTYTIPTPPFS